MKTNWVIFVCSFLFILCPCCEYDNDKVYFVDLKQPEPVSIEIDLSNIQGNDTIYIYTKTKLFFGRNIPDKPILKESVTIDGEKLNIDNDKYVIVEPKIYMLQTKVLEYTIELATNTGSLAEQIGLERYLGKKKYIVKFIPDVKMNLENLHHSKTSEKHFQLSWEKPNLNQVEVEKYEIVFRDNFSEEDISAIITDPNETKFVDKSYAYGYRNYEIITYFKNGTIDNWHDYYTVQTEIPLEDIILEYTSINSVKISWPENEYKCNFALRIGFSDPWNLCGENNYLQLDNLSETPIIQYFSFIVYPEGFDIDTQHNFQRYGRFIPPYLKGLENPNSNTPLVSDTKNNIIYALKDNIIFYYDAENLDLLKVKTLPFLTGHSYRISYSEKTAKLVAASYNGFYIFDDGAENPVFFKPTNNEEYSFEESYIAGDYLFVKVNYIGEAYGQEKVELYDVNTFEKVSELAFKHKFGTYIVSQDGNYLCERGDASSYNTLSVYKFQENEFNLIYKEDAPYLTGYSFHPINTNRFFIRLSYGEYYIIDLETKIKSGKKRGTLYSMDPFTGNIAGRFYIDAQTPMPLTILNPEMTKSLLSIQNPENRVINNTLFINSRGEYLYYFKLSKFFNQ